MGWFVLGRFSARRSQQPAAKVVAFASAQTAAVGTILHATRLQQCKQNLAWAPVYPQLLQHTVKETTCYHHRLTKLKTFTVL